MKACRIENYYSCWVWSERRMRRCTDCFAIKDGCSEVCE